MRRQKRKYEGSKNERQRGVETDELRGTGGNMGKERMMGRQWDAATQTNIWSPSGKT